MEEVTGSLPTWAQLVVTFTIMVFAAGTGIWGYINKRGEAAAIQKFNGSCSSCNLRDLCKDSRKGLPGYSCSLYQPATFDAASLEDLGRLLEVTRVNTEHLNDISESNKEILGILKEQSDHDRFERAVAERLSKELPQAISAELRRIETKRSEE